MQIDFEELEKLFDKEFNQSFSDLTDLDFESIFNQTMVRMPFLLLSEVPNNTTTIIQELSKNLRINFVKVTFGSEEENDLKEIIEIFNSKNSDSLKWILVENAFLNPRKLNMIINLYKKSNNIESLALIISSSTSSCVFIFPIYCQNYPFFFNSI